MATTATLDIARPGSRIAANSARAALALFNCAALPLGAFGLVNLCAESIGMPPLFFGPFGVPVWVGAAIHLCQLTLLGAAWWALTQRHSHSPARFWLATLIATYIALPYITPALDSLQLSLVCTALFLLAVATVSRVGAVSPLAGWMMAPMLAIVGFSATVGLAMSAAYAPPFALTQGDESIPGA